MFQRGKKLCYRVSEIDGFSGGAVCYVRRRQIIMKKEVPIWEKTTLTLEEAAAYTGIGIQKLRDISAGEQCKFVLWNGTKRLLKRKQLDEYIEKSYSI